MDLERDNQTFGVSGRGLRFNLLRSALLRGRRSGSIEEAEIDPWIFAVSTLTTNLTARAQSPITAGIAGETNFIK